eukprot:CAMPEP_0178412992 /NCGR_PEP_ID=MMETSP0689_2-20121128/22300_1 /TAXON_ID=160604 /ORGANISM="Amphidinium massartii, Strain CS-259" /LENGTH=601 /DNA_ID=CAMNT_0020034255 /DNA_START=57 /DNA_END=1859 /DNA_ORIENTATION=-
MVAQGTDFHLELGSHFHELRAQVDVALAAFQKISSTLEQLCLATAFASQEAAPAVGGKGKAGGKDKPSGNSPAPAKTAAQRSRSQSRPPQREPPRTPRTPSQATGVPASPPPQPRRVPSPPRQQEAKKQECHSQPPRKKRESRLPEPAGAREKGNGDAMPSGGAPSKRARYERASSEPAQAAPAQKAWESQAKQALAKPAAKATEPHPAEEETGDDDGDILDELLADLGGVQEEAQGTYEPPVISSGGDIKDTAAETFQEEELFGLEDDLLADLVGGTSMMDAVGGSCKTASEAAESTSSKGMESQAPAQTNKSVSRGAELRKPKALPTVLGPAPVSEGGGSCSSTVKAAATPPADYNEDASTTVTDTAPSWLHSPDEPERDEDDALGSDAKHPRVKGATTQPILIKPLHSNPQPAPLSYEEQRWEWYSKTVMQTSLETNTSTASSSTRKQPPSGGPNAAEPTAARNAEMAKPLMESMPERCAPLQEKTTEARRSAQTKAASQQEAEGEGKSPLDRGGSRTANQIKKLEWKKKMYGTAGKVVTVRGRGRGRGRGSAVLRDADRGLRQPLKDIGGSFSTGGAGSFADRLEEDPPDVDEVIPE